MDIRCYHCKQKFTNTSLISHIVDEHNNKSISILRPKYEDGRIRHQSLHYKTDANNMDPTKTYINLSTWRLCFIEQLESVEGTPLAKVPHLAVTPPPPQRTMWPSVCLLTKMLIWMQVSCMRIKHPSWRPRLRSSIGSHLTTPFHTQLQVVSLLDLFPLVSDNLRKAGLLDEWTVLMKVLAKGQLPTDNMSLFMS